MHAVSMGPLEVRPSFLKQAHAEVDAVLLIGRETIPPVAEFFSEFDFPCHLNDYGREAIMASSA